MKFINLSFRGLKKKVLLNAAMIIRIEPFETGSGIDGSIIHILGEKTPISVNETPDKIEMMLAG